MAQSLRSSWERAGNREMHDAVAGLSETTPKGHSLHDGTRATLGPLLPKTPERYRRPPRCAEQFASIRVTFRIFKTATCVVCMPERVGQSHTILETRKTKVWNRAGVRPAPYDFLEYRTRLVTGREHACREEVWILIPLNAGSRSSAPSWGILHPLRGSWTSSQTISRHCWTSSRWSAWALLMHCAAARANCTTKTVSPESSHAFSASHDEALWLCLSTVLEIQGGLRAVDVRERRRPFLWHSVVSGLRSARRTATADCWASWV